MLKICFEFLIKTISRWENMNFCFACILVYCIPSTGTKFNERVKTTNQSATIVSYGNVESTFDKMLPCNRKLKIACKSN